MHNILKWLQFRRYAINYRLLAKMGRRLRAGHRLLEPAVGVRLLPPQVLRKGEAETGRQVIKNQAPRTKRIWDLGFGTWSFPKGKEV